MKGRIMVDIADDDGALFQIIMLKSDTGRSSTKKTFEEQVEEFQNALTEIKLASNAKRIHQIVN